MPDHNKITKKQLAALVRYHEAELPKVRIYGSPGTIVLQEQTIAALKELLEVKRGK